MATNLIQRRLIFQDDNVDVYSKKAVTGEKSKSSKQSVVKKSTTGLKSRGALNDITNKSSSVLPKASQKKSVSLKKKVSVKEDEINIAEEMFLHDHQKFVEAQRAARTVDLLDLVLPERGSSSSIEISDLKPEKINHDINSCGHHQEAEELPMAEFSTMFHSPACKSPQSSPLHCDSLQLEFEHLDVYCKSSTTGEKSKQSVVEKVTTGLKSRRALNDITNKSCLPPKASQKQSISLKKKVLAKEDEVNIAEETFLHDHHKCVEAQQAAKTVDLLDLVFPKRDSLSFIEISDLKPQKINNDIDSFCHYQVAEELHMEEFSTMFQSPTRKSPESSPPRCDSPIHSIWEFEQGEFKMKEEIDISV